MVVFAILLGAAPALIEKRLQPIREAIAKATTGEPAPGESTRAQLERLYDLDQAPMGALHNLNIDDLSPDDRAQVKAEADRQIRALNARNVAALLRLLPAEGWFSRHRYGDKASTAAFLIIQHADVAVQKRFLPTMQRFARDGRIKPAQYALLYDRVAVRDGRLQKYGTQMRCVGGTMVPEPIENPAQLEERRAPMDFGWPTYADYLKMFGKC